MSGSLVKVFQALSYINPTLASWIGGISGAVLAYLPTKSKKRLRSNHERLDGGHLSFRHVRSAYASYFAMFAQSPSLPRWTPRKIRQSVVVPTAFRNAVKETSGPIIIAMTHSGNWDLAGAFSAVELAPVVTVAERVKPPSLYDYFIRTRERLGMTILPAQPGVFRELKAQVANRHVLVPLLADRDISGSGIEVQMAGHRALVAAGPAALANTLQAPLFVLHMGASNAFGTKYQLHVKEVKLTGDVQVDTQRWVDEIVPLIQEHLSDWHMMQPLFIDDLDQKRLARARERARREERK